MNPPRISNPHVEAIVEEVSAQHGVTPGDVFSELKTPTILKARDAAMKAARARWGYSTTELGRFFGRDHSTVCRALERIQASR